MSGDNFWLEADERHKQIAKTFYENIEYDWEAYDYVTSRRMCPCLDYGDTCSFPLNGAVKRIRYRGPRVLNI